MKRHYLLIMAAMLLLSFSQCNKQEESFEGKEETLEAIEFIDDNFQSQLDLLSDLDTPELLSALAQWVESQEGVRSVQVNENSVDITYADETMGSIEFYDLTMLPEETPFDYPFPIPGRLQNGSVVKNQNVFIWDAFPYTYPGIDEGDSIQMIFERAGYPVTHLRESQCTVKALKNMSNHGYVQLITHGLNASNGFVTGEEVNETNIDDHWLDQKLGRVKVANVIIKEEDGIEYSGDFFSVTDKFIKHHSKFYRNSIVFNASCCGFIDDSPLKEAFINKGAAAYFGFSASVARNFSCPVSMVVADCLLKSYSVRDVFDLIRSIKECYDYEVVSHGELVKQFTTCLRMESSSDVTWSAIPPVPTDGLVAYYPFNGNTDDASGHGNHGILSGSSVPQLTTDRKGRANSAYEFGGYYNPNWIRVPNSESLMFDKEFTVSFWIQQSELAGMDGWGQYSTTGPGFAPFCKAGDGYSCYPGLYFLTGIGTDGIGLHIGTNNSNGSAHNQSNWNHNINYDYTRYQPEEWVHVALVVENTQKILCVNGLCVAYDELGYEANFSSMNLQDIYIGIMAGRNTGFGWGGGFWYPFYGKIDDVRIYNRSLSPFEIKAIYQE